MTKFGVRPSALLAALTVILAAGCAGHTPKPAADPAGCAPGATKNVEGGFCLVLPPGAKADPPVQAGANQRDYTFGVDGHGVNVDVSELNEILTWDMTVKGYQSDQSDAERSQQQTADLPGGGKFFSFFAEGRTQVYVLTHKGDTLLTCKTLGEKPDGPTIDACKSVRPL